VVSDDLTRLVPESIFEEELNAVKKLLSARGGSQLDAQKALKTLDQLAKSQRQTSKLLSSVSEAKQPTQLQSQNRSKAKV